MECRYFDRKWRSLNRRKTESSLIEFLIEVLVMVDCKINTCATLKPASFSVSVSILGILTCTSNQHLILVVVWDCMFIWCWCWSDWQMDLANARKWLQMFARHSLKHKIYLIYFITPSCSSCLLPNIAVITFYWATNQTDFLFESNHWSFMSLMDCYACRDNIRSISTS